MSIKHNLKTHPREVRWYLCAESTRERFIFMNAVTSESIVRTVKDGWTYEAAMSFHNTLMHWDY